MKMYLVTNEFFAGIETPAIRFVIGAAVPNEALYLIGEQYPEYRKLKFDFIEIGEFQFKEAAIVSYTNYGVARKYLDIKPVGNVELKLGRNVSLPVYKDKIDFIKECGVEYRMREGFVEGQKVIVLMTFVSHETASPFPIRGAMVSQLNFMQLLPPPEGYDFNIEGTDTLEVPNYWQTDYSQLQRIIIETAAVSQNRLKEEDCLMEFAKFRKRADGELIDIDFPRPWAYPMLPQALTLVDLYGARRFAMGLPRAFATTNTLVVSE